jgi:SAM-dependent methyltransferase
LDGPYYDGGLIQAWASAGPTAIPAPLAVRSRWYRRIVAELIEHFLRPGSGRILSLGSGTGRMEAALVRCGFDVVASDVRADALELCRSAGLDTVECDISAPPEGLGRFDALYADGLLGHFTVPATLDRVWVDCRGLCDGHFVLSNDLADTDSASDYAVHGNPAAQFHRPPAGAYARSAIRSGLWRQEWSRILLYRRPGRGLRRRELLVLRAVTDARRDDIGGR